MELRDLAILDEYQDEISRLPLDTHLVLLGPPGTGKTTTLISPYCIEATLDARVSPEAAHVTVSAHFSHVRPKQECQTDCEAAPKALRDAAQMSGRTNINLIGFMPDHGGGMPT